MMTFKNYFLTAALMMMLAACSGNYDTPSGDTHVEISSIEHTWQYTIELLKNIK